MRQPSRVSFPLIVITGFCLFFLGTTARVHAQGEDIFGIERKLKPSRKAKSNLGNGARNFIEALSIEFSAGGAQYQLSNQFHLQNPSQFPVILDRFAPFQPSFTSPNPETDVLPNTLRTFLPDTTLGTVPFRGRGRAIPINAGLRVELFNMLILGVGYGRNVGQIGALSSSPVFLSEALSEDLGVDPGLLIHDPHQFVFEQEEFVMDKIYGTVGLVLWDANRRASFINRRFRKYDGNNYMMQSTRNQLLRQWYPFKVVTEAEIGTITFRQPLDSRFVVQETNFFALHLRFEYLLGEYFRLFIKGGAEFSNLEFEARRVPFLPEENLSPGLVGSDPLVDSQEFRQRFLTAQIGLAINLPGSKRCKVPGCGVKMRHLHDGVEYRGSSIFNLQNRRIGQHF
ncbi:MAG: hypothetical protein ACXIT9_02560 [Nitritalea sp.]